MQFVTIQGRRYAQFERLAHAAGLVHAFCTRPEDVSTRTDADSAARAERRRCMAADLGLDARRLCYCRQIHQTGLTVIEEPRQFGLLEDSDAVTTALPDVPLMTFSADCPLILVYDPRRRVLGLAHASWRCTVASMAAQLVNTMCQRFGCAADDLLAGIGPGAGACCYAVGADVYEAAADLPERDQVFERRDGRMYFDLWRANRVQLLASGVRADNIETAGLCTLGHNDVFFSYRREGPGCGHFGLMAALVAARP